MANPYRVGIELSMASNHAAVLGALSRSLLGIYPAVTQLTGHFDKLKFAIGGALGVGAGNELFNMLGKLIEKTKDLSHEKVQLQKLGLADAEIARIQAEAVRTIKAVPGTTELEALKIAGQTYSVVGLENALKIMKPLAEFENVIKNTTGKFDEGDQAQLYKMIRSADLLGKLLDPTTHQVDTETLQKYLDVGSKIMLATHGRVTPQTALGMAQQGGPALMNLSDEGLTTMGMLSQMMGGPRTGTAMMSLFQQMAGGTMFKRTAEALEEIGLLGPGVKREKGAPKPEGADWWTEGGRVSLSDEASKRLTGLVGKDPLVFGEKLKKIMEEHGITSNEDQMRWMFRIFGRQTTQRMMADVMRNQAQLEQERVRIGGALPTHTAMEAQNKGDVAQNLRNITAAWENLQFAIAGPNSENTITMLHALTGAINSITETARANPEAVKLIAAAIAGLSVLFIGAGAAALIAALGTGGWLVVGIGALGTALATLKAMGFGEDWLKSDSISKWLKSNSISDDIQQWLKSNLLDSIQQWLGSHSIWDSIRSWFGGGAATPTGGIGPADRLKLEQSGAIQRSMPGGSGPPSGVGSGSPPFMPINLRPDQPGGDFANAMRAAVSSGGRGGQPVVVPLTLNIDGRRIAEAMSSQLAEFLEHPTQAPYFDTFSGYAPPDNQFSST
jgi:hypothetical protein